MKFYILVPLFILSVIDVFADCKEKLGAIDFGSGTTKALVVEVDRCQKKIRKVLLEERLAIGFNEALEKSGNQKIPSGIVQYGLPLYKKVLASMRELKVKNISAVATSVFRLAKNGAEVIAEISKELDLPIQVISQEREAELGYWSALAAKGLQPNERVIVWDIGGGSMQMYSKRSEGVQVYKGDMAAVSFKNKVIAEVLGLDPKVQSSPNPLKTKRDKAVKIASEHAQKNVPDFFKKNAKKYRWIGVGGVLSISAQGQSNSKGQSFSRKQLESALKKRSQLSDDEIDSEYSSTEVTNLALVLGYMKELKIEKVETAKVTLGQGIIFEQLSFKTIID